MWEACPSQANTAVRMRKAVKQWHNLLAILPPIVAYHFCFSQTPPPSATVFSCASIAWRIFDSTDSTDSADSTDSLQYTRGPAAHDVHCGSAVAPVQSPCPAMDSR